MGLSMNNLRGHSGQAAAVGYTREKGMDGHLAQTLFLKMTPNPMAMQTTDLSCSNACPWMARTRSGPSRCRNMIAAIRPSLMNKMNPRDMKTAAGSSKARQPSQDRASLANLETLASVPTWVPAEKRIVEASKRYGQ